VVILAAEGRGFCAGVDIKEMQRAPGHDVLLRANRGCYAAFAAVYSCEVPVIAAVHGFCLGGGVGLAGNADIVVAADNATFGLPEVDRGALGAATHLSRLVPQHKARAMMYTSATATAAELHAFGSVLEVVAPEGLREAALAVASQIAAKDPTVIRAAKESLNGIDLWDVRRSYRYEQGFTFELNLSGVADKVRDEFGKDG
jgi:enoyl-CoA hydratase